MNWKRLFAVTGAMFLLAIKSRADITNGLLARLTMDQTNGLVATDATPNAHNGSLINFSGTTQWITGRTNGALSLNAATNSQRVAISDSTGKLNFGAKTNPVFSVAVWARGNSGTQLTGAGVVAKGYGRGGEQFAIDVYQGAYRFYVRNAAGAALPDVRPGLLVDGTWQLVVATFDSTDPTNGMKLYINGQLAGKTNASPTLFSNTHDVSLGSREDSSTSGYTLPFSGALDDVRIYSRALTAADVLQLYQAVGLPPVIASADADALRLRWRDSLNGGTNLDLTNPDVNNALAALSTAAQTYWATMITITNRLYLWTDLANADVNSTVLWSNYYRLRQMSLAYATAGTVQYHNPNFLNDLTNALDWMYTNRYNENKSEVDNWWHWEIGVPLWLNDISVLLYDNLSGTEITNYMNAINKFSPSPTGTGANLLWKASVVGVSGVIIKSASKIGAASSSLSSLFPYVTASDGFYTDGSFLQHGDLAYNGSYGSSLLIYLAPLMQMLNGSAWQVTDTNQQNIYQWVYNSYQPLIYNGRMMDMVRGRAISRQDETDQSIGQQTVQAILQLTQFAPGTNAAAFKSMVKYWIQTNTAYSFTGHASLGCLPLAAALMADTTVPARGELIGHYHFGSMDRVAHLQPGYAFGISMFSSRIANFEAINGENYHAWYTADGMTYLYNNDQTQFDDFWPTVNPYRLPGTTVDTETRANSSGAGYRGANSWVGGAGLNGYGAAGMQLDAWNSTLTANKSWFMFGNEIGCLGAGINNTDSRTIETIVENRKLNSNGDNTLTINGAIQSSNLGWSATISNISWAHLAGSAAGADVGYYFPQPVAVDALREARAGSWYDLNTTEFISTNDITRNYFTLWYDHGTNPVNAGYAYVLLPGMSASQVGLYAATPQINIVQNSSSIQAASQKGLGLLAANIWNDGTQTIGGITVNRKSSLVTQHIGTNLYFAIADPTQTNTAGIVVTFSQPANQVVALDPGVTVNQLSPVLQLTVNTSGAHGKSFRASFTTPNQPPVAINDTATAEPGMPLLVDALANDSDPDNGPSILTLLSVGTPIHGSAILSSGLIQYTSAAGYLGADSFTYVITDGALTATGRVDITVGYATNFSSFQQAHFTPSQMANPAISSASADPDHDGLNNLLEYAMMTDPLTADKSQLNGQFLNNAFSFTYTKRKFATDIQYVVEVSNDLSNWDGSGNQLVQTVLSDNGSAQVIQVSEKSPNAGLARFFRLRIVPQ